MLRQLDPQILRNVEHVSEVGDAAHIEPVPQLLGTHPGLTFRHDAGGHKRFAEFGARQADQGSLAGARGGGPERVARGRVGEVDG